MPTPASIVDGERLFPRGRARRRQLRGDRLRARRRASAARASTAVQAEKWSGIRLAIASRSRRSTRATTSTWPLMGDHAMIAPPRRPASAIAARRVHARPRSDHRADHRERRPVAVLRKARARRGRACRAPGTARAADDLAEKILARQARRRRPGRVRASRATPCCVRVDGGYSHEFTTAQVDAVPRPRSTARLHARRTRRSSPCSRTTSSTRPACASMAKFSPQDRDAARHAARVRGEDRRAELQRRATASRPASATRSRASSIIEPGDFVQATDSHTCMGGASGALAWGVGATEYAALRPLRASRRRRARVDPLRADRARCRPASRRRT